MDSASLAEFTVPRTKPMVPKQRSCIDIGEGEGSFWNEFDQAGAHVSDSELSVEADELFDFFAHDLFQALPPTKVNPQSSEVRKDAVHPNRAGTFRAGHAGPDLLLGLRV